MQRFKGVFFSVMNFALIAAVLVFIILGLNRIGIFVLPDMFPDEIRQNVLPDDDGEIYDSLLIKKSSENVRVEADLTPQGVKNILDNVVLSDNYYQKLTTTLYAENKKNIKINATVRRTDGFTTVSLYNSKDVLYKEISQLEDGIKIKEFSDAEEKSAFFSEGSISLEEESGVVMTHKYFYVDTNELSEGDYSVAYTDYGTIMQIVFDDSNDEVVKTKKYWLSLDYGVVVRAEAYENDSLVYKTETSVLTSE